MRAFIFILWILLGIGYWFLSRDCCPVDERISEAVSTSTVKETSNTSDRPLLFDWSDGKPKYGSGWNAYRDSIKTSLKPNQILQITGLYSKEEKNNTTFNNLGLARADKVRTDIGLAENRTELKSQMVPTSRLDKENRFVSAQFTNLIKSDNVKEERVVDENNNIQTKTTIYFPFNSTNKLNDSEVENYLNDVASKVRNSGEKVRLTGHTDNIGSSASNIRLGERRATIVKDYLIRKGVTPNKIITASQGEASPIASNDTDNGRAKNRRTELQIIK